jgi:DNA-binding XRE family transcriptional regulator
MGIPALPFCGIDILSSKPKDSAYPKILKSIGDHIRAKRIEKGLFQSKLAELLRVSEATITNWENNLGEPQINYIPQIILFLSYNPYQFDLKKLSGRIKKYRYKYGLSHRKMGEQIGVDASTIASWENEEHLPQGKFQIKLNELLIQIIADN